LPAEGGDTASSPIKVLSSQNLRSKYLKMADNLLERRTSSEENLIDGLLHNYFDSQFLDNVEKLDRVSRNETVRNLLILFAKVGKLISVSSYISVDVDLVSALIRLLHEAKETMEAEACYLYRYDETTKEMYIESASFHRSIHESLNSTSQPHQPPADIVGASNSSIQENSMSSDAQLKALTESVRFPNTKGIASKCYQINMIVNVRESSQAGEKNVLDPTIDAPGLPEIKGLIAIPLKNSNGLCMGVLVVANKVRSTRPIHRNEFSMEDEFLCRVLGIQAEMVIANAFSYDYMRKTQKKVEVLLDTTRSLSSQLQLDNLIQEIMRAARELLNADRCTLFLLDAEKQELWSQIPDKDGKVKNIRFPSHLGIAGAVCVKGTPINIHNAYSDPRFNPAVDKQTGYLTKSILCMPIKNADGTVIGVTQMINKINGSFTTDDEQLLDAFSAQAAVAIEKSVLFQQTEKMRDYLDSILQSLTSCVISLSQNLKLQTINRVWLIDHLGLTRETMEDTSIDQWLGGDNYMLLQDIKSVLDKGVSTYSSDYELKGKDSTKIINYSIVRHIGGDGVVVIIDDISNERRALSTLSRYMSPELAKLVMQEGSSQLGGTRKKVSILFSDIRSFTTLSEAMSPPEVVELLNQHFTHCVNAIVAENGILDKFIGDAIMGVFGVPFVTPEDAVHACNTALRMVSDVKAWNMSREQSGLPIISIGVGINTGEVLSGNIGSEKRMEYSCIGDHVNLSSRVEGLTKQYGVTIMITEYTKAETAGCFQTRELDTVVPVGKKKPIVMYELVAKAGEVLPQKQAQQITLYEASLKKYYNANFEEAISGFQSVLALGKDKASDIMLERCRKLLEDSELRSAFNGVYVADSK
jgi:adenylate cyclase